MRRISFDLDSTHQLIIAGDGPPRPSEVRESAVCLEIRHVPRDGIRVGNSNTDYYGSMPKAPVVSLQVAQNLDLPFYGPYPCERCGCLIVKASMHPEADQSPVGAGAEFDHPAGPIYPNTVWVPHVHREPPPPRQSTLAAFALEPSFARAIASALLSSATEARR